MKSIEISDAQDNIDKIIDDLEAGREHEIILLRDGKAVAKLVPGANRAKRRRRS